MVRITSRVATTCSKSPIETPEQHCVKYAQIQAFCDPQGYDQKRKLSRTNSFVLARSSAKKFYIEQLTVKSSIEWYHITLI